MFVYCSLGCVFFVLAEEFIPNSVSWQLLCNSVSWWQQIQRARRIWGYQSSACLSRVLSGSGSEQLPSEGAGSGFAVGHPCPERAAAPRQEAALGAVLLCWARTLCWARSPQSLLQLTAAGYVPSRTSSRRRAVLVCVISLLYGSSLQFPVAVSSG